LIVNSDEPKSEFEKFGQLMKVSLPDHKSSNIKAYGRKRHWEIGTDSIFEISKSSLIVNQSAYVNSGAEPLLFLNLISASPSSGVLLTGLIEEHTQLRFNYLLTGCVLLLKHVSISCSSLCAMELSEPRSLGSRA